MESYIQISKINDFTYCPATLYLHGMYEGFSQKTYHAEPQVVGKLRHEVIEEGVYSTSKNIISGLSVYSERYNIMGKIDIYDRKQQILIERKTRIKKIYPGHRYQLYAQAFCMEEMGYPVKGLKIHSLEDNKSYVIPMPSNEDVKEFERILTDMRTFDSKKLLEHECPKCKRSIYGELSW